MFIGSSREFLAVAKAVRDELQDELDSRVWDQGVFALTSNTLEDLSRVAREMDLAAFVFGADDITLLRKNVHDVPRDNVVFELGMFMGALDKKRCFFLVPQDSPDFHVPSDLAGITSARFDPALAKTDPRASVRAACNEIRGALSSLRRTNNLSGSWVHKWTTPEGKTETSPLDLLQLGSHVRGTYQWNGLDFELRGRVERGRFITADYRCLAGEHGYSGTLHLIIKPDGRTISGKWAGWSSKTGDVNAAACEWTRV